MEAWKAHANGSREKRMAFFDNKESNPLSILRRDIEEFHAQASAATQVSDADATGNQVTRAG